TSRLTVTEPRVKLLTHGIRQREERMTTATTARMHDLDVPRGLAGVAVAPTAISDVDGLAGFYHYRGTNPAPLARTTSYEDIWFLLHTGELPTADKSEAFADRVRSVATRMPPVLRNALPAIAALGPPGSTDVLRTAISAAGVAFGCRTWTEQDRETTEQQVLDIASLAHVFAAALYRQARGLAPVEPSPELGLAANYLLMIHGTVPDPERVAALNTYLVLAADHGFCNSTFAERVITSSGADAGAALAGAIGGLSGPLHGGAIGRVPSMLEAIGESSRVESWITERLNRGERLRGFGHAVYQAPDPRTTVLRELAREIGDHRFDLYSYVERKGIEILNARKSDKHREANIELYAGMVLEWAGIPEELFLSTFAVARMAGWTANYLEQVDNNRIFRPSASYIGRAPQP
ncbi:MAG: citrate/2-methylcitrate synthase, partial [Actinomycetota bacterium]